MLWLALWSLLLLPVFSGYVPVADDLGAYHLPLRAYYQSALQAGENWTWCPWIFGGYHLHGEGQIGGDHPLHQLLYRVLPLPGAFGLECWWAYPATFFGMWWWLRQMRFSTAASQVAGLALSLCGFMTLRVVHTNAVQVIAHLPWLLGCLTWLEHRARRSTTWRSLLPSIACSALLTGSQLLLGYPQYVVFTLIAESLWTAALFVRLKQRANATISPRSMTGGNNVARKQPARLFALAWIAAKGIGLLLGASQVLPTLEYLALSERVNWTAEQMFEGSWPPLNLTQLVAPYLFTNRVVGQNTHELTIFMGIVPVCLAVLGLVNRPRRSLRAIQGFALALGTVGLLLALGDMSPLAEVMPYIPVWNRFRFPCRATLLLCLGIALLAALGWQRICDLARTHQARNPSDQTANIFHHREWRTLWFYVAATCCLPLYASLAWPEHVASYPARLIAPLLAIVTLALFQFAVRAGPRARNLIPVLLCLELWSYAMTTPAWKEWNKLESIPLPKLHYGRLRQFTTLGGRGNRILSTDIADFRAKKKDRIQELSYAGAEATIATHSRIDGYAGVRPQRFLEYNTDHDGALKVAGVSEKYVPGTCETKFDIGIQRTTIDCLQRGTLVTKTQLAEDRQPQIEQLNSQTTALVEAPIPLAVPSPNDRLQIQLTADRPGHLSFALETNRDALLVTTESYHPGWRVRVDGADVPALRVNGDFLGARVARHSQHVVCDFSDNWHAVGRGIGLGSLGLLGLVLCLTRIRQNAPGFVR